MGECTGKMMVGRKNMGQGTVAGNTHLSREVWLERAS